MSDNKNKLINFSQIQIQYNYTYMYCTLYMYLVLLVILHNILKHWVYINVWFQKISIPPLFLRPPEKELLMTPPPPILSEISAFQPPLPLGISGTTQYLYYCSIKLAIQCGFCKAISHTKSVWLTSRRDERAVIDQS